MPVPWLLGSSDQDNRRPARGPGLWALPEPVQCNPPDIQLSSPHGGGQSRGGLRHGDTYLGWGLSHILPASRFPQRHPSPI